MPLKPLSRANPSRMRIVRVVLDNEDHRIVLLYGIPIIFDVLLRAAGWTLSA